MRLSEILEAKNRNRRNRLLYFRQTVDSIIDEIAGKTIIVFDTETTGISVKLPWVQITEIAAVAIDADTGKEIDRFHYKVRLTPETKAEIQRQMAAKTSDDRGSLEGPKGLNIPDLFKMSKYGEKNAEFKELTQVYKEWVDWLGQFDSPIMLGQNAGFDMGHMWAPLNALGLPRPKIGKVMDTMVLARAWIYPLLQSAAVAGDRASAEMLKKFDVERGGKTRQSFALGTLGKVFDVPADHWHSGISDALQTYGIFSKMVELLRNAKENGYDTSEIFKLWHSKMSGQAYSYGKRPAFSATVDSETKKGIKARGGKRRGE